MTCGHIKVLDIRVAEMCIDLYGKRLYMIKHAFFSVATKQLDTITGHPKTENISSYSIKCMYFFFIKSICAIELCESMISDRNNSAVIKISK